MTDRITVVPAQAGYFALLPVTTDNPDGTLDSLSYCRIPIIAWGVHVEVTGDTDDKPRATTWPITLEGECDELVAPVLLPDGTVIDVDRGMYPSLEAFAEDNRRVIADDERAHSVARTRT